LPALLRSHAENLPSPDAPDFATAFDRYADARVVLPGAATHGTHEFYAAHGERVEPVACPARPSSS
jgi:erythromycin esterase-like protein